jgi:hypothetical protein
MSYTEFHTGKLKKIKYAPLILEDWCKNHCMLQGSLELLSYNKTWKEQARDVLSDWYFINGEDVYQYIDHEKSDGSDSFMKFYKNDDETISFVGSFYNGGTCFEEMLEDAFKEFI